MTLPCVCVCELESGHQMHFTFSSLWAWSCSQREWLVLVLPLSNSILWAEIWQQGCPHLASPMPAVRLRPHLGLCDMETCSIKEAAAVCWNVTLSMLPAGLPQPVAQD